MMKDSGDTKNMTTRHMNTTTETYT